MQIIEMVSKKDGNLDLIVRVGETEYQNPLADWVRLAEQIIEESNCHTYAKNKKSFGELFFGGLMGGNPVPRSDGELLGELLAVIHGDGGHYQQDNGTEQAVNEAIKKVFSMKAHLTLFAPDAAYQPCLACELPTINNEAGNCAICNTPRR